MFKSFGLNVTPEGVLEYSQYCSNVLIRSSGVVLEEKLRKIISKSGRLFKVDIKVMVLPLPGGPHRINGLFSLNNDIRIS